MAQSNLEAILSVLAASDTNTTRFDAGWAQGRSAFGGLSAAFAVVAMDKRVSRHLPLRSLLVSFIAPIPPGEVRVETRIRRQGKNVTQISAEVLAQGHCCLQAMAVYGHGREAIAVPPPQPCRPPARTQGIPFAEYHQPMPAFLRYFDGCWAGGGLPYSGSDDHTLQLWARHPVEMDLSAFPAAALVAIADIPPPVLLSRFKAAPVPASSLTWSLEFLQPPAQLPMDWFYLHFTLEAAAEGYTQQSGRIFTEDGTLCALSRQCMVYFGPAALPVPDSRNPGAT